MGQSPPGHTYNRLSRGTPLLNGPTEFGPHHPIPAIWTTAPTKVCKTGDLLFCVRGSTTGRMNWADRPYCLGRGVAAIRAKNGNSDTRLIYYNLVNNLPRLLSFCAGSVFPNLSRQDMDGFQVQWPDKDSRPAIAHILGTLDDKIELNRRINETLEAMARTIFKSWFVDFDPVRAKAEGRQPEGLNADTAALFPDAFEDTDPGEIPHGWDIKSIEDVAKRVGMGPFGSSIKVASFVGEGIPIVSGQHLRGFMLEDNSFNFITQEHAEKLKSAMVFRGDVVFTHAGNIGQVAFIPEISRYEQYIISQRQFYMRCDLAQISPSFVTHYFKSPEGQHKLLANTSSAGVPSIARPVTHLRSIRLPVPPKAILDEFEKIVQPVYLSLRHNMDQIDTLAAIRDVLLPKLLSGEVPVKDPEKFLEVVA